MLVGFHRTLSIYANGMFWRHKKRLVIDVALDIYNMPSVNPAGKQISSNWMVNEILFAGGFYYYLCSVFNGIRRPFFSYFYHNSQSLIIIFVHWAKEFHNQHQYQASLTIVSDINAI